MSVKLTKSAVAALTPRATTYIMYDRALPGFGVRVTPAGVKSWVYEYRPGGGRRSNTRRVTLGKVQSLAAEKARAAAQVMHHRARLGDDPAREREERCTGPTVNELADKFMAEAIRIKRKPRTADLYEFYFRRYISPELGTRRACDLSRADVARFHRKIGAYAPVTANRLLQLLSGLYNWAMSVGELAEGSTNPARGHDRYREQARERYLTSAEWAQLGDALREAETIGIEWTIDESKPISKRKHAPRPEKRREIFPVYVTGAIKLLVLTGCRKNEILRAKWSDIDFEHAQLRLSDSKTGARHVPLSTAALAVINNLPRLGTYMIAGQSAGTESERPRADLNRPWAAIRRRAGLGSDVTLPLRHSFASIGVGGGLGLVVVGGLLGHWHYRTTQRYAHLDADPLRAASDRISSTITSAMGEANRQSGEVVELGQIRK